MILNTFFFADNPLTNSYLPVPVIIIDYKYDSRYN